MSGKDKSTADNLVEGFVHATAGPLGILFTLADKWEDSVGNKDDEDDD